MSATRAFEATSHWFIFESRTEEEMVSHVYACLCVGACLCACTRVRERACVLVSDFLRELMCTGQWKVPFQMSLCLDARVTPDHPDVIVLQVESKNMHPYWQAEEIGIFRIKKKTSQ